VSARATREGRGRHSDWTVTSSSSSGAARGGSRPVTRATGFTGAADHRSLHLDPARRLALSRASRLAHPREVCERESSASRGGSGCRRDAGKSKNCREWCQLTKFIFQQSDFTPCAPAQFCTTGRVRFGFRISFAARIRGYRILCRARSIAKVQKIASPSRAANPHAWTARCTRYAARHKQCQ